MAKFEALGPVAPAYLKGLARERRGYLREQVQQILILADAYGTEAVHTAMSRAHNFGKYSYGTVKNILERQATNPDALPDDPRRMEPRVPYTGPEVEVEKRSPEDYARVLGVAGV